MFHCFANQALAVTATLTELAPIVDGIIPVNAATRFFPPEDLELYSAMAYGTNLQRVRLTTPSLRQYSPVFLRPLQPTLIGANDANSVDYTRAPLRLRAQEDIQVEAIQNAGADQRLTVVWFAGRGRVALPPGQVYVIRATGTTTLVVQTWTAVTYTLDSTLPAGRYAVVMVEGISVGAQAIRCTFDNQFYRPGAPGLGTGLMRLPMQFMSYSLGVWGHFHTFSLPRVEMLSNVADTAEEIYFHVIPVG